MFELNDVNLVYDLGKEAVTHALQNINLKCDTKGLIGVLGPSGSGKSSMLYLMAGLKNPTSGQILYNGKCLNKMPVDARAKLRRNEFGFMFQRGFLIDYLTVLDNVLVPINDSSAANKRKALELLEMLNIGKLAQKRPYQISGGQRQRVAIARALINNPEVVFADEPTAALDHDSAMEVMKILSEYGKEKLVIIVTHDTSILSDATRTITIWDGVIKQSSVNQCLANVEG